MVSFNTEGTGGREGGREGGGFFLGKHEFSHIFDGFGAIPPRFSSGKRTLPWFS